VAERYAIRPDYRPNLSPRPREAPGREAYWSDVRVAASDAYQYYVYRWARRLARRRGARSVLDVGSGPGTKLRDLFGGSDAELVLVDHPATEPIARRTLPRARFVAADLETAEVELGRRFDLVICADVLEHLRDPDPCLALVRRHVAPGGLALLSTPDRENLRGPDCTTCPHDDHVREWSGPELADWLTSRGFELRSRRWFPLARLRAWEYAASRVLGPGRRPARWAACQAVAVRPAESLPVSAGGADDVAGGEVARVHGAVGETHQRPQPRRPEQDEKPDEGVRAAGALVEPHERHEG